MPRSGRPDPDDPAACEHAAVGLLARREHSRQELVRKLRARGYREAAIAEVVDRLEQAGLLDTRRFAAGFVESRAARGTGPVRIRAELMERGVSAEAAAEALRESRQDWCALARRARRKRFGGEIPEDFKTRARQAQFLQYRGFDARQVDAALSTRPDPD